MTDSRRDLQADSGNQLIQGDGNGLVELVELVEADLGHGLVASIRMEQASREWRVVLSLVN